MLLLACVAASATFSAFPSSLVPSDGAAVLSAMKEATAKLERVHAVVRVDVTRADADEPTTRYVECWIDCRRGRVRSEVRDHGRAGPNLASVAGPEGVRVHQLEVDDIAEQKAKQPLDLPTALASTFSGELLATAFRGDLVSFKPSAYGKPELGRNGETIGKTGCTRLTFDGNSTADLWVGDLDRFPRRIRGELAGMTLDETIVELDLKADFRNVDFEIPVPEGRKLPGLGEVRDRWSSPPPEPERWPRPEDDAPDFAALDLDARQHMLSETGEHEVVLAFWFTEDERSPPLAAELDKAWKDSGSKLLFLHIAAGDERDPVARAVGELKLTAPVWIAAMHPQDAFRRWRIWTCPVFARVNDMQVVAVTKDVEVAKGWFR